MWSENTLSGRKKGKAQNVIIMIVKKFYSVLRSGFRGIFWVFYQKH